LLEEKFIHDKLFEILKDLNKDRKKLLLLKKKMSKHSDKDAMSKIYKLIKTTLNV
jgi:UDP-N-acetylglucosamine:LPS N-acetylglucosamine transferase